MTDRPVDRPSATGVQSLRVAKRPHRQAAALPWRQTVGGVEIMLVTSRGRRHWLLPKGWPERNERLHDAAAREAFEEAGLRGTIAIEEFGRYQYVKGTARNELACEVSVFPMEVLRVSEKWKESGQRVRQWMGSSEAVTAVQQPDLRMLLAAFFETVSRKIA